MKLKNKKVDIFNGMEYLKKKKIPSQCSVKLLKYNLQTGRNGYTIGKFCNLQSL